MKHRIAVMPGDGVGPEIVKHGLRVLRELADIDGIAYELTEYPHGADHYRATGELISDATIDEIGQHSALLFGAAGDPSLGEGVIELGLNVRLFKRLDLSLNVRPGRLYLDSLTPLKGFKAGDIDIVLVRESSEDCFVAPGGFVRPDTADEVSIGLLVYTRKSTERTVRYAFELAMRRSHRLALITQANAVPAHTIWTRVTDVVAKEYPEVAVRRFYPDSGAMALITEPQNLDVLLTTYWIGGTLTNVLGAIVGGMGLMPSARYSPTGFAQFEPAHGSALADAGKNVVSPIATILAVAMMLDHLGEERAARRTEQAVAKVFRTGDVPGVSTRSQVGTKEATDAVIKAIRQDAR